MSDSDDITLLKRHAGGDESAFTVLLERHVHLVYSTALRHSRNPSHEEDVTQAVFKGYTVMQLMQIFGDRNVRIVPDAAVNGAGAGNGLVEGLVGVMLKQQNAKNGCPKPAGGGRIGDRLRPFIL